MAVIKLPRGGTITTFPVPQSELNVLSIGENTLQSLGLPSACRIQSQTSRRVREGDVDFYALYRA